MRPCQLLAALAAALTLAACTNNCEQSAEMPSQWLPSPWPGYQGHGEKLTQGAAYGVAIGMSRAQVHASVDHHFRQTATFCGVAGSAEFDVDPRLPLKGYGRPDTVCPSGDTIDEIWEADPSILCGLCQAEILDVLIVGDRVTHIEFRGTGCMIG